MAVPTIALLLFAAWWWGLREPPPDLPDLEGGWFISASWTVPPGGLIYDEEASEPLQIGNRFPTMEAAGWLNGPPRSPEGSVGGITVIDVWNDLCPVCRYAAPGLRQIQEEYKHRNVRFLGLTSRDRYDAKTFIEALNIDWPNGYGIEELRDAAPQVFVLDRDGQIVWYDERLRYRHEPQRLVRELGEAIDCALADSHASALN